MISRVSEHCFWMARYLERAENTARVLEVNRTLLLDFHVPVDEQWRPVLAISDVHDYPGEPTAENVQGHMTWDRGNPVSIASSLARARENARVIRNVISAEMWERVNFYHLWMQGAGGPALYDADRHEFYARVRRVNQLVHGIAGATMSYCEAWEFFRLGAYLERASQTARIMDVKYHTLLPRAEDVGTPVDAAHWAAILTSCSGSEPFHKAARPAAVDPGAAVAEFLIYDDRFPRSVRHCLRGAKAAAEAAAGPGRPAPVRLLADLIGWLDGRTVRDLIRAGLHESLRHLIEATDRVGDAVHAAFFAADVGTASSDRNGRAHAPGQVAQRQE